MPSGFLCPWITQSDARNCRARLGTTKTPRAVEESVLIYGNACGPSTSRRRIYPCFDRTPTASLPPQSVRLILWSGQRATDKEPHDIESDSRSMNQTVGQLPPLEDLYDVSRAKAFEIMCHAKLPPNQRLLLAGELTWEVKSSGVSSISTFLLAIFEFITLINTNEVTKYLAITQNQIITAVETSRQGMQDVVAIPHSAITRIEICRRKAGFWTLKPGDARSHIHIRMTDESVLRFATENHDFAERLLVLELPTLTIQEIDQVTPRTPAP